MRHTIPISRAAGWLAAFCAAATLSKAILEPNDRMQFADGLYVRGFYELAVKEYLAVVGDEPANAPLDTAVFRAGECYRQLGRREMAERFYKRILTDFPQSPHRFLAEFRRAELFVGAGQYADAAQLLRTLLESKPPDEVAASARYYLGYSLYKTDLAAEAEQNLKAVIEQFPESPFFSFACLALAELYQKQQRPPADIRALFKQAADKPASPRTGAEALFQWGDFAYRAGAFEESARAYAQLLERYPDDRRVAEARVPFAWAALQADQFATVLALADERLAAGDSSQEDWLYLRANCLRQLQRPDEALAAYGRLLEQYPRGARSGAAAYEKALIAFRRGDYAAVMEQAASLQNVPGVEEDAGWLVAESLAALGKGPEAVTAFAGLAARFPSSDRAPRALFRQAELQQAAGAFEEAAAVCRKLVEVYPKDALAPEALFLSAFCQARLGRHKEALRDSLALLKNYPDDPRADLALYQAAMAEIQLEKPQDALKTLQRLLKEHPGSERNLDARVAVGILHEEAGRLDEAEAVLREALAQKPKASEVPGIQYRLAGVLQKQGKEQEAAALIQQLLDSPVLKEMPPALLEWLADLQLRQGAPAKALGAAKALVACADTPAWKQIGWYWIGRSQEADGKIKPAREAYEKVLAENARTAEAAETAQRLGDLALAAGDVDRAVSAYTEAAERAGEPELMPVRARAYFGLGQASAAREQWEEAARYFMSVAVLFDDPELAPRSLHEAAAAFDRLGRSDDRRKTLEELRARYPGSEWARPEPAKESS